VDPERRRVAAAVADLNDVVADQGAARLANHTCKRAATASGRLSRYFIRYFPDSSPKARLSASSGQLNDTYRTILGRLAFGVERPLSNAWGIRGHIGYDPGPSAAAR